MTELTFWQKARLYVETHQQYPIAFAIAGNCLLIVLVAFHSINLIYIYAEVVFALFLVTLPFIIILDKKTSHWWYEEYPDNEHGQFRQFMAELQGKTKGQDC